MNMDKALKLLNLTSDYTEEDLKREYRRLILEYHPDKHSDEDRNIYEEKTKLLNQAKEILVKNLKDRQSNSVECKSYFEDMVDLWGNMTKEKYDEIYEREIEKLCRLKKKYKEELCDEMDYILDINVNDNLLWKYRDRFLEVMNDFFLCIDDQPSTISLEINYQMYKKKYYELLVFYLYDNFNTSKILDFVNSKLKVNEKDNLKSLRTKMIMYMNEILNKELDEFRTLEEYDEIKPILLGLRNGFVDLCLWGYIDIEKAKIDFKNKIVLELNNYKKRKQMVDDLINYYRYPSKLVIDLYNNILNEDKFNLIYNSNIDMKTKVRVKIKKYFNK